jgi:hypothetical protein
MYAPHLFVIKTYLCLFLCYVLVVYLPAGVDPAFSMEAIFNAINRPRPRVLGMNEKLIEFLSTKPPTFGGSVNPLDADDWLRAILRGLEHFHYEDRDKVLLATNQLNGTALAWWENYCAAVMDPSATSQKPR